MSEKKIDIQYVWRLVQRLGKLYIENARLTLTERLTQLMANAVVWAIVGVLGAMMLLFLSICLCEVLIEELSVVWACLIFGGFYLLLIALVFIFRRPLFINPICRFLSRLIMESPTPNTDDNEK